MRIELMNLFITNEVLYQLSYTSIKHELLYIMHSENTRCFWYYFLVRVCGTRIFANGKNLCIMET